MTSIVPNLRVIPALPLLAAASRRTGTECRQRVAHGASRGLMGIWGTSPGGALEYILSCCRVFARDEHTSDSVAPDGAWIVWQCCPTGCTVGYSLPLLRG